jgi:site-specific recombinase XerD
MLDGTSLPALPVADPMDPAAFIAITFLSGFHNRNTRDAYATDLRLWFEWCATHQLPPLAAKRAHMQAFAINLTEQRKNSAASVSRRIGTLKGFYETAVLDGHLEYSPAHHLKLPTIHPDDAARPWLNRWELGALMRAARVSSQPVDLTIIKNASEKLIFQKHFYICKSRMAWLGEPAGTFRETFLG